MLLFVVVFMKKPVSFRLIIPYVNVYNEWKTKHYWKQIKFTNQIESVFPIMNCIYIYRNWKKENSRQKKSRKTAKKLVLDEKNQCLSFDNNIFLFEFIAQL